MRSPTRLVLLVLFAGGCGKDAPKSAPAPATTGATSTGATATGATATGATAAGATATGATATGATAAVSATQPTGPCAMFTASNASAYTGLTPGVFQPTEVDASTCKYTGDGGDLVTVTIARSSAAFDAAPGVEAKIAMLEKAKWDAASKTLAAIAHDHSLVIKYGPAAKQADQDIAGNAAQFIAMKLKNQH